MIWTGKNYLTKITKDLLLFPKWNNMFKKRTFGISQSKRVSSVKRLLYSYLSHQEEERKLERNKEVLFIWIFF